MTFRKYIDSIDNKKELIRISQPVSRDLEIAGILKKLEPEPVMFDAILESQFRVIGNLFCTKETIASYFQINVDQIIPILINAIEHRKPCGMVNHAACQEIIDEHPDLDNYPLLFHCENDGGKYISSGVMIANHPEFGQNVDFHRCMQISTNELAVRVVKNRHLDAYLQDLRQVDVAICIGNSPNVLLAAATSVEKGVNELEIASALKILDVVKAHTVDVYIPAETEFVLEGTIFLDRKHSEGPFVDLTETQDIIRQEPVMVVKTITHRKDAIWQALLPGALEHKILMGMPREPTIFQKVNQQVECLDVNISPGGCSWLHAIVKIRKKDENDGMLAIKAAFEGHRSCKHVFVVDEDIDIYDPLQVEWALATRFQGDRDMLVMDKEPGSSLDPSANPENNMTTKIGFDLTGPLESRGKSSKKVQFPDIELKKFLS